MQTGARAHPLRVTAGPNHRGDARRDRGSSGGGGGARQKFSAPKRLVGLDTAPEVRAAPYVACSLSSSDARPHRSASPAG